MPKAKTFEEQYPHLSRFVEEQGWIELGYDENIPAFGELPKLTFGIV